MGCHQRRVNKFDPTTGQCVRYVHDPNHLAGMGGISIKRGGQIEICVSDTGQGLPPGKADQIFDAFFTTKPQGSGMGLAISKSIIESHGGRIWADGIAGCGATFHFTLPFAPVESDVPVIAT